MISLKEIFPLELSSILIQFWGIAFNKLLNGITFTVTLRIWLIYQVRIKEKSKPLPRNKLANLWRSLFSARRKLFIPCCLIRNETRGRIRFKMARYRFLQYNRYFKPLLKKANLPDIRLYDLRHSCATVLLAAGEKSKDCVWKIRPCFYYFNPRQLFRCLARHAAGCNRKTQEFIIQQN